MFAKIKNYFTQKRERNEMLYTALLLILNDSSDFYRMQKEVLELNKKMNDSFNTEEMKKFVENINQFVKNPKLTEDFYRQIAEYGHKERIEELKNRKNSNDTSKVSQSN